jgi:hypothetical protein
MLCTLQHVSAPSVRSNVISSSAVTVSIPVEVRRPVPLQKGTAAHPTSRILGAGYFPSLYRPGSGANCSGAEVANSLELYLRLPSLLAQTRHGVTLTAVVSLQMRQHYIQ